jgi:ribosomal protein S18 acetylase RimI-like enzyme
MPDIIIKRTDHKEEALSLAKDLPDFFSKTGLISLEKDLEEQILYGAFTGTRMVGFIILRKADIASLEISWLAVKSNSQRQGIGSKLVKDSLNLFSTKGYKICYVKTLAETIENIGYAKTRAFYKKLGFYTLEIISPYPGWTVDNPCQILAAALPLK